MLKNLLVTLVVALSLLFTYGVLIEPNRVVVREVTIPSPRLHEFFEGATVVHVSDFQCRGWGLREMQLEKRFRELAPDYVFVTGDFAQGTNSYEPVLRLLASIPQDAEVYGVLGNTDYNGGRHVCLLCHEEDRVSFRDGPIRMLRNETLVLERNGRELALVGLDRYDEIDGGSRGIDALENAPFAMPKIVLAHTPHYLAAAGRRASDLYLAGDTHGGQVAAPRAALDALYPEKVMEYRRGLFATEHGALHVSSGVGWNEVPVRIGVPPEIVLLRFVSKGGA